MRGSIKNQAKIGFEVLFYENIKDSFNVKEHNMFIKMAPVFEKKKIWSW